MLCLHFRVALIFSHKRERDPPPYTIHRPRGSLGLTPPCPEYGVSQPELIRGRNSFEFCTPTHHTHTQTHMPTFTTHTAHIHSDTHTALLSSSPPPSTLRNDYTGSFLKETHGGPETITRHVPTPTTSGCPAHPPTYTNQTESSYTRERALPSPGFQEETTDQQRSDPEASISLLPPGPSPLHLAAK